MIRVTDAIAIQEEEIEERFVLASGPGGQHVNKTATAVELRFDARRSPSLSDDVAIRLLKLAGARATKEGVIVIVCDEHRSQKRNRETARERLIALIAEAAKRPKLRRATRPTAASREQRLAAKTRRSGVKRLRGGKPSVDG